MKLIVTDSKEVDIPSIEMMRGLPRTIVRRYALQNHMNGHDDDPRKETQAMGGERRG